MNRERIDYLERIEEKAMSQVRYLEKGKIDAAMSCITELALMFEHAPVVDCVCECIPADNSIAFGAEICVHCYTIRIPI